MLLTIGSVTFHQSIVMPLSQVFVLVLVFFIPKLCTCANTITFTRFIMDPEAIVSNGTAFKLGFFSPVNSTQRYVGVFYNASPASAIWVANRERPLNDARGTVAISEDGNLVVLDGRKEIIWSSNVSNSIANSSAQILDSGNLVLMDNTNGGIIWESFKHPTDSFLQGMSLGTNLNTNEYERNLLTSWKSASDPSVGRFSASLVPMNIPQIVIWNGNELHWRSGPWNGQTFIGIPNMYSVYLYGFNIDDNKEGAAYVSFTYVNDTFPTYYILTPEGNLVERDWIGSKHDWEDAWSALENVCDVYGRCGPFGSCDSRDSPICTCLEGFEPKNTQEWNRGNWSGGCVRRSQLQCDRINSTSEEGRKDGFLRIGMVKVPDFAERGKVPDYAEWSKSREENCEGECLNSCSCIAYAQYDGIGCMQWSGSLIDIQKFPGSVGADLYIRVAYSELAKPRNLKVVISITVTLGLVIIAVGTYISWKWMAQKRGRKLKSELLFKRSQALEYTSGSVSRAKIEELPLFTFEKLAIATESFHSSNKLGQGGFGPVYKGTLPDGQEVAVKRLSRSSGQGLEEFMNEVVVISKLQHRNLVRLLGCCVESDEKILIYEYMPNGSLDALLFEPQGNEHLIWSKRINIIEGICRGLLYLHRDSRLRIIHRDLKASNILLDDELNPKISDFGMARIFGGNQDQANTARVVGTYGYMAPEYAMEGRFSEKSDVYSFGVLLLEIVSGRRNNSFYQNKFALNLLAFAWNLWNEEKVIELIDPTISEKCSHLEILRYIHVGLLCVQGLAKDRPNISAVLSMLSSEIADLPTPKQPAFTESESSPRTNPQQSQHVSGFIIHTDTPLSNVFLSDEHQQPSPTSALGSIINIQSSAASVVELQQTSLSKH